MGNSSCSCFLVSVKKAEVPQHSIRPNEGKVKYWPWPNRSKTMEKYARFLIHGKKEADASEEKAGNLDDKKVLLASDSTDSKSATAADHSLCHWTSSKLLLRSFNYAELRIATRNFRPDTLLGEGGFGSVFKGWVCEHGLGTAGSRIVIAVKKLNLEGLQGHKEWLAEVNYLGQLHHPNLVRLIGFCAEDDHRLLVYEFMPRGSLENHLFRRNGHGQALSWAIRMKVAVGAARGLTFLHEAEKPVIFRDLKASNILLDSKFNPKLSDFGLAKDGPTGDNTHVSTRVMGTYGYAAPEYVATGHLTAKSDVYSFGVVLLELITGRRAVDKFKPYKEQNLVDWAWPYLIDKRKLLQIIDPRLQGLYSMKGACRAADLALSCLNSDAKLRPAMKEVVQLLEPSMHVREKSKYSRNLTVQGHVHRLQQLDPYEKKRQIRDDDDRAVCAGRNGNLLAAKCHEKGDDLASLDFCNKHYSLPAFHSTTRTEPTS